MSVSFPDVLGSLVFLALGGVVVSGTAHCKALYPRDYVCHPALPSTCLPLDILLSFRSRISRILLHKYLPYVVPYFNQGSFETFADLQSWIESGSLASLPHSKEHLTLALALICQGLLEAERDRRDGSEPGIFEVTAGQLLAAVLAGPWVRVASSGWPVFALLGRLARLKAKASVQCAGPARQWKEMMRMANHSGVQWPTFNLTVWDLADFRSLDKHWRHLDRSCLWDAADHLTIPAGPVCVSIPAAGEPQPLMAARDCNLHWPHCEIDMSKAPHLARRLRYWMHLPQRRELTVDYIHEEQRPFCTHQRGNLLLMEAQELFSKLLAEHSGGPKRPLKLLEVGSHFGDCTLIVYALAQQLGWPLRATCFEPVRESVQVFRRSLRLNAAGRSIVIREMALTDGQEKTAQWHVPEFSGVHASAVNGLMAQRPGMEGSTYPVVPASSLDLEVSDSIDLLLLSVAGDEMATLQGAKQLLLEQRVKSLMTFTWNLTRLQQYLNPFKYQFVAQHQLAEASAHVIRSVRSMS